MKKAIGLGLMIVLSLSSLFQSPTQAQSPVVVGAASDVDWNPDGTVLAISGTFGVAFYNTNFALDSIIINSNVDFLDWSPSGDLLATASYSGTSSTIELWDLHSNQSVGSIAFPYFARALYWSSNNQLLAILAYEKVEIYEITNNNLLFSVTPISHFTAGAWNPDSTRFAIADTGNFDNSLISIWDVQAGSLDFSLDLTATENIFSISDLAWNSDGATIALGVGLSTKGFAPLLDIPSQTISDGFGYPIEPPTFLGWNSEGNLFAATDAGITGSTITVWNANTYTVLWYHRLEKTSDAYLDAVWKPNGNQIAVLIHAPRNNIPPRTVHILDATTGEEIAIPDLPPRPPTPTP